MPGVSKTNTTAVFSCIAMVRSTAIPLPRIKCTLFYHNTQLANYISNTCANYNFTAYNINFYRRRVLILLSLTYVVDGARSKFPVEFLRSEIA